MPHGSSAPGVPNRTRRLMHLPIRRNRRWPAQSDLLHSDAAPTARQSLTPAANLEESSAPRTARTFLVPTSKRITAHDPPTAVRPSPPRSSTRLRQTSQTFPPEDLRRRTG